MAIDKSTCAPDGKPAEEQPVWREQFPIDTAKEAKVNRRQVVACACATGAALIGGQAIYAAIKDPGPLPELKICQSDELSIGQARLFHYPGPHDPCLLIRVDEGDSGLLAYSQACTHLACPVVPEPAKNRLFCPCHQGAFDLSTGEPIAGPPQRPLPKIDLSIRAGDVYAIGIS